MKVNEIFYSIQGEGWHTGKAAVFIRFAGCNLSCPFCDTNFKDYTEMSEDEIVDTACEIGLGSHLVVITGGEPSLQLTDTLVDKLHKNGFMVAVETNGTRKLPFNIDWITISPKVDYVGERGKPVLARCSELKVVFDGEHEVSDYGITAQNFYLQPCDTGNAEKNAEIVKKLVDYVKRNTRWKISLQTQKMLNVR